MKNCLSNIALIILNYNSAELTIKAVKHILKFETELQLIVVDNCSRDGSKKKLLKEFGNEKFVHLIFNDSNFGYAYGNNVGILYAEQLAYIDTVAIMNPDVIVTIDTLKAISDKLSQSDNLAFVTAQTYFNGKCFEPNECAWKLPTFSQLFVFGTVIGYMCRHFFAKSGLCFNLQSYYSSEHYEDKSLAYVDVVQGCFFMGNLKTFLEVGKLDVNTFLYYEENILGEKVRICGKKNAVLVNHFIHHNHQVKDASLIKRSNKIFDMTCMYNSRDYYIQEYFQLNFLVKLFLRCFLKLDFYLRKAVVSIMFKD